MGNTSVYQKISGSEKFYASERGVSSFFVENFLSHSTEKFHWRTLWGFRKFFYRKFSCIGGGGASRFCRNFLSHRTETKSFVKEPFCFPEIFWYRKKFMDKRGLSRFSVEIFMSHNAENFRKGILLFLRKFLVSKNFMDEKEGITFFRRKFFVSQCRKTSYRNPLRFH